MTNDEILRIKNTLGDGDDGYYVYALLSDSKVFYIGKGYNSRVLAHEEEAKKKSHDETKTDKIEAILAAGDEVEKVIIKWGLTEKQAFAAESALINLIHFCDEKQLTNIVNGHATEKEKNSRIATTKAMTLESFLKDCATETVYIDDLKIPLLFVHVEKFYRESIAKGMPEDYLYDCARGAWMLSSKTAKKAKYALALYNGIAVAAYPVASWKCIGECSREEIPMYPEELRNVEKQIVCDEGFTKATAKSMEELGVPIKDIAQWKKRLVFTRSNELLPPEIQNLIGKTIQFHCDSKYMRQQNTKYNFCVKNNKIVYKKDLG